MRRDVHLWNICIDYYFPLNPRIQKSHTKAQYRFAINNLSQALGRPATIADLTDDNILRMVRYLLDQGLAARTINDRRGRLNCLWTWLSKRGLASGFPTATKIPEPQRTPQAWTHQQLDQLFAAVDRLEGMVGKNAARIWWRALLLVCWDTGERIGALLNLDWEHIDLEHRWIHIPAELRKGGRKDMTYRFAEDTAAALLQLHRDKQVFIWPYHPCYLWPRFNKILARAGLPCDRRSKFHRIRRSFASHLKAAGGDPQAALGHSSAHTTHSYLDPRIATTEQAIDRLFRPPQPAA